MKIRLTAYRHNDLEHGETIRVEINNNIIICAAGDIDEIISKLTEARDYAINAAVEDERKEFVLDL